MSTHPLAISEPGKGALGDIGHASLLGAVMRALPPSIDTVGAVRAVSTTYRYFLETESPQMAGKCFVSGCKSRMRFAVTSSMQPVEPSGDAKSVRFRRSSRYSASFRSLEDDCTQHFFDVMDAVGEGLSTLNVMSCTAAEVSQFLERFPPGSLDHVETVSIALRNSSDCLSLPSLPNATSMAFSAVGKLSLGDLPKLASIKFTVGKLQRSVIEKLAQCQHLSSVSLHRCEIQGSLASLSHLDALERVEMVGCVNVDDAVVGGIAALPRLKRVTIRDCPRVKTVGLLADNAKHLERIDLSGTSVSNDTLDALSTIKSLKRIDLERTRLASTASVDALNNGIEVLNISSTFVNQTGLDGIQRMHSLKLLMMEIPRLSGISPLRFLNLRGLVLGEVDDEMLKVIGSLSELVLLVVERARVSSLVEIARLRKLEALSISNNPLGEKDIARLHALEKLRFLAVSMCTLDSLLCFSPQARNLARGEEVESAAKPKSMSTTTTAVFPALEVLDVSCTDIVDGSLVHLQGLPCLSTLLLHGCQKLESCDNISKLLRLQKLSLPHWLMSALPEELGSRIPTIVPSLKVYPMDCVNL